MFALVKCVQTRSFLWSVFSCFNPNTRKYGSEKTPYLGTFQAVAEAWYLVAYRREMKINILEGELQMNAGQTANEKG